MKWIIFIQSLLSSDKNAAQFNWPGLASHWLEKHLKIQVTKMMLGISDNWLKQPHQIWPCYQAEHKFKVIMNDWAQMIFFVVEKSTILIQI